MSIAESSSPLLASLSGAVSLPMKGPKLPTCEVEKNTGSISAKSRSACMRCMSTDPTIPRHPTNPTRFIPVSANSDPVPMLTHRAKKSRAESKQRGNHRVAHFPGTDFLLPGLMNIQRTVTLRQNLFYGCLDAAGRPVLIQAIAQHHRGGQNGRERICQILAGDVRRRAVNRLVKALAFFVERSRRQHADRAGQHRSLVRKNVAKHVAGNDDVELFRILQQLHRCVVHVHVRELDSRKLFADRAQHFAPELRSLEHVRLVHRAKLLAAFESGVESRVRDPADLRFGVAHGVEALATAALERADAARLAEVDVARQLAH